MNNYDVIPQKLRTFPNWVMYKNIKKENEDRIDKIPYQLNGEKARTDDASTWASFANALKMAKTNNFDGIGFVFSEKDPFCGIDLDKCIDSQNHIAEEAKRWIKYFNSYSELSPSGKGIHIIIEGKSLNGGRKKGGYECYDQRRFFTFTGRHLHTTPLEVKPRNEELKKFCDKAFGLKPEINPQLSISTPFMSDDEVIKKAITAKNGEEIRALLNGEWENRYPSQSEATAGLLFHLAFWTRKNVNQMDRIFRRSKLYRKKWDERRGQTTWGQEEINRAISKSGEVYKEKPTQTIREKESPKEIIELPLSLPKFLEQDIPPIEYYVSGLLPKKGKGMISAYASTGKSVLAQNLALAIACGKTDFLGRFNISPAKVLYLDLEMGKSALKERFQKMCVQESLTAENLYVRYLPSIDLLDEANRRLCEKWLGELGIEVFIIDPLGNAWSGNPNDQQEVSQITAYLNTLIEKYGLSILTVHHWRKATKDQKTGGQMAAGSYRWEAWLDCHITLEGEPSNIILSCQKSRNAPSFDSFIAKINEETLWLDFIADYEKKFDETTLIQLFEEVGSDNIAVADLAKLAEKKGICKKSTVYKLARETNLFKIESIKGKNYLTRKEAIKELF